MTNLTINDTAILVSFKEKLTIDKGEADVMMFMQ